MLTLGYSLLGSQIHSSDDVLMRRKANIFAGWWAIINISKSSPFRNIRKPQYHSNSQCNNIKSKKLPEKWGWGGIYIYQKLPHRPYHPTSFLREVWRNLATHWGRFEIKMQTLCPYRLLVRNVVTLKLENQGQLLDLRWPYRVRDARRYIWRLKMCAISYELIHFLGEPYLGELLILKTLSLTPSFHPQCGFTLS